VYQIASDLAAENEEQSSELKTLRLAKERQRQDIETRDARIALLETEFAMANMAPPRNTIVKNHFADTDFAMDFGADFGAGSSREALFSNSDFDDGTGRLRSLSSLGYPAKMNGGVSSPRFDAPGTPSMMSSVLDVHPQRAQSSMTQASVATHNVNDIDDHSVHYSSDMSSLSDVDEDGSDLGYPEDENYYPIRVGMGD